MRKNKVVGIAWVFFGIIVGVLYVYYVALDNVFMQGYLSAISVAGTLIGIGFMLALDK